MVADSDRFPSAVHTLEAVGVEVQTAAPVDQLFGIHPSAMGISVYADDLATANCAVGVLATDPAQKPWPMSTRYAATEPAVAVSAIPQLADVVARLTSVGVGVIDVDPAQGMAELDDFEAFILPSAMRHAFSDRSAICGVSVPHLGGGVTVVAGLHQDAVALDVAAMLADIEPLPFVWPYVIAQPIDLVVFGAHLRGQPLEHQLTELGARWEGEVHTAPRYRMTVLPTQPAKPGVLRVSDAEEGTSLVGHRWRISPAALGIFLAKLPPPMQLGQVELADGSWEVGFGCDASAATGPDISAYGGWLPAIEAGAAG